MNSSLRQAVREILRTYGDRVSVIQKQKSLWKFGRSTTVPNTGYGEISILPTGRTEEVYLTTNGITHISSEASDTQSVLIEGHTVDGSGNKTFVIQSATLNGTTKVALSTPLARATRMQNDGSTDLTGPVHIYEDTAITGGVPTDTSKIHLTIAAGENQSEKGGTALSSSDYWLVQSAYADVLQKTTVIADVVVQTRLPNKVWLPLARMSASTYSQGIREFANLRIVPPNSDIRMLANASTNNITLSGGIRGWLATVDVPVQVFSGVSETTTSSEIEILGNREWLTVTGSEWGRASITMLMETYYGSGSFVQLDGWEVVRAGAYKLPPIPPGLNVKFRLNVPSSDSSNISMWILSE